MGKTFRDAIAVAIVATLVLTSAAGCGKPASPAPPAEGHATPPEARIDAEKLKDIVAKLAAPERQGRLAGSPAGIATADWLVERFGALGLTPKGSNGFVQPFTFTATRPQSPVKLALVDVAQTRPYAFRSDFRVDPASGSGNVTAQAVFAGYGLSGPGRNDYQGPSVRGKTVMFIRDCPPGTPTEQSDIRARVSAAISLGAVAVLIVDQSSRLDLSAATHPVSAGVPVVAISQTVLNDLLVGSKLELSRVMAQLEKGPVIPEPLSGQVRIEVNQATASANGSNIVGYLPGTDPGAGYFVVGAHYDHLGQDLDGAPFLGVFDNATGVAAMLEVARILTIERPVAGVLFVAFDAEEEGLFGSAHLSANLPFPTESLRGVINLDTLGSSSTRWQIDRGPGADRLAQSLAEQARELGVGVEIRDDTGNSDHHAFALRGLPALRLTDETPPARMHRTGERVDDIDFTRLAKAGQAVVKTINSWQQEVAVAAPGARGDASGGDASSPPTDWMPIDATGVGDGWVAVTTPHFTIRFRPAIKIQGNLSANVERIYDLVAERLTGPAPTALTLTLTTDGKGQEAAVRSVYQNAANPITDAWVHYPSGTMVINAAGRDQAGLAQAVAHEAAHLFAAAAMGKVTTSPWGREYLATYIERRVVAREYGQTDWDSKEGMAKRLSLIKVEPWSTLAAAPEGSADQITEAVTAYFYLEQQYGVQKLSQFWQLLLANNDPKKAFKAVYKKTAEQLETEWRKYFTLTQ